jgi:replicative superfamily II helicase/intein/homing endonuclease
MDVDEVPGVPDWLSEHLQDDGIESLYPPQAEAVEAGVTEGSSLVASVPTASGKTLVAELAMLAAVRAGGKALYIVPLRALASEKKAEFEAFEQYGVDVGVSTGNYESSGEWLAEKDVIVATSEKVDSLVRNGAPWIDALDCVVADEVHLVDDGERGPTLEVTLAKLRQRNPQLQVVALSATIGNADELAAWLDAELVDSTWRPIDLRKGVHYGQALHFDDGDQEELRVQGNEKPTAAIGRDTLEDEGSTLVFVNSRRNAEAAAKRLASTTNDFLDGDEFAALQSVADEIRDVSDTETSEDLADAVEQGAAFHHAGLCVTGDTQILRPDGRIESICDVVDSPDGGAVGMNDFGIEPIDITGTFEMDERPALSVATRTGNELGLSKTHPLPTLGPGGIEWVQASELEPGMYVARPRELEVDVEAPVLRELIPDEFRVYRQYETVKRLANEVDTDHLSNTYRQTYERDRNLTVGTLRELCDLAGENPNEHLGEVMCQSGQKPVSIPYHVDNAVCWLAGAVAGDGYLRESDGTIALTGKSKLLEEFEEIVREQFGREVSDGGSPTGTPFKQFTSKIVTEILSDHFGMPGEKENDELQVPSIKLPDELIGSYLSGLFDADGSVSLRANENGSPCIEFYSTSETLIRQLKTTLLRFGIVAYRDEREVSGREEVYQDRTIRSLSNVHRLTIYGTDQLKQFQEKIGFRHEGKSDKLVSAIEINPAGGRGQLDVIPTGLGEGIRSARQEAGISLADLEPGVPKATLSRYENDETPMKRQTFQALAELLDDDRLKAVACSDLFWDKIDHIEERGPEPLYDLSTSSTNFVANGIVAHNTSDHRSLVEDAFRDRLIKVVSATPTLAAGVNTPSRRVVVRDWRRYSGDVGGMKPLSVLEVHQMMGRAGRPGLDPYGEALLLATSHDELDELFERYVWAEPEPVQSKLAAEPAMRTHLLATVASGFADSREGLLEFLERTLYATQTDERGRLETVVDDMLAYLKRNDFLESVAPEAQREEEAAESSETAEPSRDDGNREAVSEPPRAEEGSRLTATGLGHTVSRLYLDPMSAATIIDGLADAGDEKPTAFGLYQMISRTPDMYELYLRSGDREEYTMELYEREDELLGNAPSEFEEARFDDWLAAVKTARLLEDWASELDEDRITERYGVGPGDIRGKVNTAEWLLGAAESLAGDLGAGSAAAVREAKKRVQYGVRDELIDLAGVRGVGRKRARRLFEAGIQTRADLRNAEKPVVLAALRGRRKTAETVLENAGHQDPDMDGVRPDPDTPPAEGGADAEADGGGAAGNGGGDGADDQSSLGDF